MPPGRADARQERSRTCRSAAGMLYEPKWDGFRCIVFRDGDEVELASRNEQAADPLLPRGRRAGAARSCRSGAWSTARSSIAARGDRLDFEAAAAAHPPGRVAGDACSPRRRRRRSSPSTCSRSATSRCVDVPFARAPGRGWTTALREARARRSTSRRSRPTIAVARGLVRAVRGRRARRRGRQAARRRLRAGQARHAQDQARAHRRLRGRRVPRGTRAAPESWARCCSALRRRGPAAARRRRGVVHRRAPRAELVEELAPYRAGIVEHPWRAGIPERRGAAGGVRATPDRMPGGPSRWNGKKDLSFVPLRPELRRRGRLRPHGGHRFRHTAPVQALAPGPRPGLVHLRPARRGRPLRPRLRAGGRP